jgi:hypothetical protein
MMDRIHDSQWQPAGRPMAWYQWLAILILFGIAGGVRAESFNKCIDAHGDIAYQSTPCAGDAKTASIDVAPAPAYAPSPTYSVDTAQIQKRVREPRPIRQTHRETEAMSYECRTSDGQVFYRHSGCPRSVAAIKDAMNNGKKGSARGGSGSVTVSSLKIPREEACRQIHAAGAIGRSARGYDDDVSTYDRNLGRDPCR